MKPSVRKGRPLDVETKLGAAVPAEPGGRNGTGSDEDARIVAQLPAEPRRLDLPRRGQLHGDRERLARKELLPLVARRPEQPHLLDACDVASPLLQPGRALLRVALAREELPVRHDRIVRRAVEEHGAVLEEHCAVAETLDRGRVVRYEHDGPAALLEVEDLAEALALERLVADGEHLVQQENVGFDVRCDRETEPHVHPRRVGAHGQVDEVLESRERDDLVELLADGRAWEAVNRAVEVDVLAASHVGMEAGAELQQRADAASHGDAAARRLHDSGEEAEERRLPGAVATDERECAPRLDVERDVAEGPHIRSARLSAREEEVLQRAALARIDAEAPRRVLDRDLAGRHAGDGTDSSRRTIVARASTNGGSSFGMSMRSRSRPSSAASSFASTSMSHRISRWSETKPTGQMSTRSTPCERSSRMWSRTSGPSHGSPVGLSLWNENDHVAASAARSATRLLVSSS